MPADEAVRLAIQIASALEEAHHEHILHRDLKPGNIVVTPKGTAKLLDFGLARLMEGGDETRSIAASGTPLYMSPEQIENQPLDARSDVFSFGAVLYEFLSGRRAFDSVGAVLRDTPAPLEGPVRRDCATVPGEAADGAVPDDRRGQGRPGTAHDHAFVGAAVDRRVAVRGHEPREGPRVVQRRNRSKKSSTCWRTFRD